MGSYFTKLNIPSETRMSSVAFGEFDAAEGIYSRPGIGAPFRVTWDQFVRKRGRYYEVPESGFLLYVVDSGAYYLIFVAEGELNYTVDGKSGTVKPAEVLYIPIGLTRRLWATGGVKFYLFMFREQASIPKVPNIIHRPALYFDEMRLNMQLLLLEEFHLSPQAEVTANSLFRYLCNEITQDGGREQLQERKLACFFSDLETDLQRDWTVAEMARVNHLSESHFYAIVKSTFGRSPLAWLREIRLNCASKLLVQSGKTVENIGYMVGYHDTVAFIRAFKRQYQCTPLEFRRKHQNKL